MFSTPETTNVDYERVYEPSEDSFLMLDCMELEKGFVERRFEGKIPLVTEIGIGSGIVSTFIQLNILPNALNISTDINPHACVTSRETYRRNFEAEGKKSRIFDVCQMSLSSGIRANNIDLLVFNPPYVPNEEIPEAPSSEESTTWLDLALVGGKDGMIVTSRLLEGLHEVLTPDCGVAYILFCARNHPDDVASHMRDKGWNVDVVITRKAGWEVLSVLKFYRSKY